MPLVALVQSALLVRPVPLPQLALSEPQLAVEQKLHFQAA
jgi:hypothetical protein